MSTSRSIWTGNLFVSTSERKRVDRFRIRNLANFYTLVRGLFSFLIRFSFKLIEFASQDFHEEYAKMAFKRYDPEGTGFISALDFNDVIINAKSHLLTPDVKANLIAVGIEHTRGA